MPHVSMPVSCACQCRTRHVCVCMCVHVCVCMCVCVCASTAYVCVCNYRGMGCVWMQQPYYSVCKEKVRESSRENRESRASAVAARLSTHTCVLTGACAQRVNHATLVNPQLFNTSSDTQTSRDTQTSSHTLNTQWFNASSYTLNSQLFNTSSYTLRCSSSWRLTSRPLPSRCPSPSTTVHSASCAWNSKMCKI